MIFVDKISDAESYSMRPFDKMNRSNVKLGYNILNNVYRDIDAICALRTGLLLRRSLKSDRIFAGRLLSADIDKAVNI